MNLFPTFSIPPSTHFRLLGKRLFRCAASVLLLLLISGPVLAQKEKKAKEWLDRSAAAFRKAGALSIDFTLNARDVPNQTAESFDGRLELHGTKFHLNTPDTEIWFDGQTQWALLKAFDEIHISEPTAAQALNPAAVLTLYQKDCDYQYLGEKTGDKGRKVQEVELIPRSKDSDMARIAMQIGAADAMPRKIHVVYKNKIESIIHINQYQPNPALTDRSFVFDPKKYPDAEIIDLR
jgi:outer membrane lipoprotein-sorting protein